MWKLPGVGGSLGRGAGVSRSWTMGLSLLPPSPHVRAHMHTHGHVSASWEVGLVRHSRKAALLPR